MFISTFLSFTVFLAIASSPVKQSQKSHITGSTSLLSPPQLYSLRFPLKVDILDLPCQPHCSSWGSSSAESIVTHQRQETHFFFLSFFVCFIDSMEF